MYHSLSLKSLGYASRLICFPGGYDHFTFTIMVFYFLFKRLLRAKGESTLDKSYEELEEMMRLYVFHPALTQLSISTCNSVHLFHELANNEDAASICEEFSAILGNISAYSLEELSNFAIRVRAIFSNVSERSFDTLFAYYDVVDSAQIEVILENWDKDTERAQLDALLDQIALIPSAVLGVSVNWVKISVSDYYGQMEARHQMLSNIVSPREAAAEQQAVTDTEARTYYISTLWEAADQGLIEGSIEEWQSYEIGALRGAAYNASILLDRDIDFSLTEDEIYGVDSWRRARQARTTALFILSFVPIVGTVVDIIEAYQTVKDWQEGRISGGEAAFYVALSLIGPLGDVADTMRVLANTGNAIAEPAVRAAYRAGGVSDDVSQAFFALEYDDIIRRMRLRTDELDEMASLIQQGSIPNYRNTRGPLTIRNANLPEELIDEYNLRNLHGFEHNVGNQPFLQSTEDLDWIPPFLRGRSTNLPVELGGYFHPETLQLYRPIRVGNSYFERRYGLFWRARYSVNPGSIDRKRINLIFSHFHPSGFSFSRADVMGTIQSRLSQVRAFTHQGVVYILEPTTDTLRLLNSLSDTQVDELAAALAFKPNFLDEFFGRSGPYYGSDIFENTTAGFQETFSIPIGNYNLQYTYRINNFPTTTP